MASTRYSTPVALNTFRTAFCRALQVVGAQVAPQHPNWWPNQSETTAVSWALGLELIGQCQQSVRWIHAAWGSQRQLKSTVLQQYHVRHRSPNGGHIVHPSRSRYDHDEHEFMVDFAGFPRSSTGNEFLFAMESEAFSRHNVGSTQIDPTYGYSWDFAKLLYIDCPMRVFVARVDTQARRQALWGDLTAICLSGTFNIQTDLIVYVIASKHKERGQSEVGLWSSGKQRFGRVPIGCP